jgi:hypothetical protein
VCAGLVDGDLVVDAPVLVVEVSGLDASITLPEVFFGVVVVFGFCVFLCVDFFPDASSKSVILEDQFLFELAVVGFGQFN